MILILSYDSMKFQGIYGFMTSISSPTRLHNPEYLSQTFPGRFPYRQSLYVLLFTDPPKTRAMLQASH